MPESQRLAAYRRRASEGDETEQQVLPPKGEPLTETTGEPSGEPETPAPSEKDEDMPNDTPLEQREDYQAGVAAGAKAANDRMNAVFAHEHTKGREAHAVRLLGRQSLSAEDITAELEHFAPAAASALSEDQQRAAAEEGGRKEMQAAMEGAGNKDLGAAAGADENKGGRKQADAVWDKANAAVGRLKKEA